MAATWHRFRVSTRLLALIALLSVVALGVPMPAAQAAPMQMVNFGVSGTYTPMDGGGFAYGLQEARAVPARDLNGDWDTLDLVVHRVSATGVVQNLRVAAGNIYAIEGGAAAIQVPEWGEGNRSLNGDTDTQDYVLLIADTAGTLTNTGLEVEGVYPQAGGSILVWTMEYQHGRRDLNGDGDVLDFVMHRVSPTGAVVNLGLAATWVGDFGGGALVMVREYQQGNQDLNGDGDSDDALLHRIDAAGAVTNLDAPGAVELATSRNGGFVIGVDEMLEASDLNGDGDADDVVAQVGTPTGTLHNSQLATWVGMVALDDGRFVVRGSEPDQGQDLNGDGDTTDAVAHVLSATGVPTNTGLAAADAVATFGGGYVLQVVEAAQGGSDLNGDGDTADVVAHRVTAGGAVTNLGHTGEILAIDGGGFQLEASEEAKGGVDLNGDGDGDDTVVHVVSGTGSVTNLGLALGWRRSSQPYEDVDTHVFPVSETAQGHTDFNGDGDAMDDVLHWADAAGAVLNVGLASRGALLLDGGGDILTVWELDQGATDLNGDGDATDNVIHVFSDIDWPPMAALATTPTFGPAPLTVGLDASGSRDPNGTVVEYRWDFDGNGTVDQTSTTPTSSHTYTARGRYMPAVTVVDNTAKTSTMAAGPIAVGQDRVALTITGGVAYTNTADLTSGNIAVARDTSGIKSVRGSGKMPGVAGGSATVAFNLSRFLWFPFFTGNVTVVDPSVGLSLNTPAFFSPVRSLGPTDAAGNMRWVVWSNFRSYTLDWRVSDTG